MCSFIQRSNSYKISIVICREFWKVCKLINAGGDVLQMLLWSVLAKPNTWYYEALNTLFCSRGTMLASKTLCKEESFPHSEKYSGSLCLLLIASGTLEQQPPQCSTSKSCTWKLQPFVADLSDWTQRASVSSPPQTTVTTDTSKVIVKVKWKCVIYVTLQSLENERVIRVEQQQRVHWGNYCNISATQLSTRS